METVPVPIVDENETSAVIYILTGKEALHSTKFRNIYFFENARIGYMQEDWL